MLETGEREREREQARDYNILIIIILYTFFVPPCLSPPLSLIRISYIMMMVNESTEALWCVDVFHSNLSFGYVALERTHGKIKRKKYN